MIDLRMKKTAVNVNPKDSKYKNFHKALAEYLYKEFKHEGLPVKKRNVSLTVALKNNIEKKYEKVIIDCLNGKMYLRGNEVKDKYWGKLRRFEGGQRASDAYHCVVQSAKRIINRIKELEDQINEEDKEVYGKSTIKDLRKKKDDINIQYIVRRDMRTKKANKRIKIARKDLRKISFGNLTNNDINIIKNDVGSFFVIGIELTNEDKKIHNKNNWLYYDNHFSNDNIIGACMGQVLEHLSSGYCEIIIDYIEIQPQYRGSIVFKSLLEYLKNNIFSPNIEEYGVENIKVTTDFENMKLKMFLSKQYPEIYINDLGEGRPSIPANCKDLRRKKYTNLKDLRKIKTSKVKDMKKIASKDIPFIGIITKDGQIESYNEEEAEKNDYHHSFIFSKEGLQQFDNDETLRFVRIGGEKDITIEGNSSLDPFGKGYDQIKMMAQEFNKYGYNANIKVANQNMNTKYEGKAIGSIFDFLNNKYSKIYVKDMRKTVNRKDLRKKADINYYNEAHNFINKLKQEKCAQPLIQEIYKSFNTNNEYAVALAETGIDDNIISQGVLNDLYKNLNIQAKKTPQNRILAYIKKINKNNKYSALKMHTIEDDYLDEGPEDWDADNYTPTRWLEGTIDIDYIKDIPGANNEVRDWHEWNGIKYFGNYPEDKWYEFLEDIKQNGIKYKIFITVDKSGDIRISEGNHRIQACLQLGIKYVPVEIRYFGNSQKHQDYFDKL